MMSQNQKKDDNENLDLVVGWRKDRKDDFFLEIFHP